MTTSVAIGTSADWQYKVSVNPVKSGADQHSFAIHSQWLGLGAKDRRAKVRQIQITLPIADLRALYEYLGGYLYQSQDKNIS